MIKKSYLKQSIAVAALCSACLFGACNKTDAISTTAEAIKTTEAVTETTKVETVTTVAATEATTEATTEVETEATTEATIVEDVKTIQEAIDSLFVENGVASPLRQVIMDLKPASAILTYTTFNETYDYVDIHQFFDAQGRLIMTNDTSSDATYWHVNYFNDKGNAVTIKTWKNDELYSTEELSIAASDTASIVNEIWPEYIMSASGTLLEYSNMIVSGKLQYKLVEADHKEEGFVKEYSLTYGDTCIVRTITYMDGKLHAISEREEKGDWSRTSISKFNEKGYCIETDTTSQGYLYDTSSSHYEFQQVFDAQGRLVKENWDEYITADYCLNGTDRISGYQIYLYE